MVRRTWRAFSDERGRQEGLRHATGGELSIVGRYLDAGDDSFGGGCGRRPVPTCDLDCPDAAACSDCDAMRYRERLTAVLATRVQIPRGYSTFWSGQYEALQKMRQRLMMIVPLTLAIVLLLIRVNTRSWVKTGIVMLAVPFSAIGALWALYLLGYHLSTAVWVGLLAPMGIDAQTGVFMLLYLDLAYRAAGDAGRLRNPADLREAVVSGAAKRIRPKFMTVATVAIGLFPIPWSTATGADLMKRIAAPMVGGLTSSFLMELLVYPVIYMMWRQRGVRAALPGEPAGTLKPGSRVASEISN